MPIESNNWHYFLVYNIAPKLGTLRRLVDRDRKTCHLYQYILILILVSFTLILGILCLSKEFLRQKFFGANNWHYFLVYNIAPKLGTLRRLVDRDRKTCHLYQYILILILVSFTLILGILCLSKEFLRQNFFGANNWYYFLVYNIAPKLGTLRMLVDRDRKTCQLYQYILMLIFWGRY